MHERTRGVTHQLAHLLVAAVAVIAVAALGSLLLRHGAAAEWGNFALTSPNGFSFTTAVSPPSSSSRNGKDPLSRRDVSRGKRQSRLTVAEGWIRSVAGKYARAPNPLLYPNLENKRAVGAHAPAREMTFFVSSCARN